MMEPLRSEEMSVSTGRLVSRTAPLEGGSIPALDGVEPPRALWHAPDGSRFFGYGTAATLRASGAGRFEAIEAKADALYSDLDYDGPLIARPRLFGGFAFHPDHRKREPWSTFPGALFVLPRIQVTQDAGTTWITASEYGAETSPESVEERLDAAIDALSVTEMRSKNEYAGPDSSGHASDDSGGGSSDDSNGRSNDNSSGGSGDESSNPARVVDRRHSTDRASWRERVEATLRAIDDGTLSKVVLAQTFSIEFDREVSIPDVLDRLDEAHPNSHRFFVAPTDEATFFGATPERLVSLRGHHVEAEALAGSTERGATSIEDELLGERLSESVKDRHEHALVVQAIRERLDPFCTSLDVGDRSIRQLPTVQHLRTPIEGTLADDEHVLSLVESLHPTPAVGGIPPEVAQRTIRETEPFDRGWYAGPVGWFDADGDGEFAVAIRSAIAREETVTLFAGAGVVRDSDPDEEWDEVQLKYRTILDALR